jgi:anti-anti-sigma regulatory factor
MAPTSAIQAHIAYELIDDNEPHVVVIDFLSEEIVGPLHARELGEQLASLTQTALPQNFVMDLGNVRSLGSSAFAEIVGFAHKLGQLTVCNLHSSLRLGAAMVGLDECADLAASRLAGINSARRMAIRDQEATVDYPASMIEFE